MVIWTVFFVIALVIAICALLQKLYNERKITIGQRDLAGKVGDDASHQMIWSFF